MCNTKDKNKHISWISLSSIYIFLTDFFNIVSVIISVKIIELIISKQVDYQELILLILQISISMIIKNIFYYLSTLTVHNDAYTKLAAIRRTIINKLHRLSISYFTKQEVGRLTNIVDKDVEQMELYLAHAKPEILSSIFIPIIISIYVLFMDYRLFLSMISGLPLLFLMIIDSNRRMSYFFSKLSHYESKMKSMLIDYVKNIATIKSFSREENITEHTLDASNELYKWNIKTLRNISLSTSMIEFCGEVSIMITISLSCYLFINNDITLYECILAYILVILFSDIMTKTGAIQHYISIYKISKNNIQSILGEKTETPLNNDSTVISGDIEIRNLTFFYNTETILFDNISLIIREKSYVSLIGYSGSGKTTLTNLIMGINKPINGTITINNTNIAECDENILSNLICNVSQDVILFDISIYENILIGKQDATKEEVIDAAKRARCHEFIQSLPFGYDTKIGEMGNILSGGEKQRISIARMILKDSPIIILDEISSSLDPINEKIINQAILELSKNKTIINISHNMRSIINSDEIFVIGDGEILNKGKHNDLYEKSEIYKNMYDFQIISGEIL